MRLIYYWNILLLVLLCACGAEVGERDNPFDGGADMTDYERDVSGWSKGSEGEVKHGNISSSCYVYENKFWRLGNDNDCSLGFGGCIAALQDSLRQSDSWYKCDKLMWRLASAIETDTAGWGKVKDGEVRIGQVNTTIYYIYETSKKKWRNATTIEMDTYDYTNNKDWAAGKDGDSKAGSVNANNCYVYENKAWRSGNASDCSLKLRGCTALRQDTVGKGSDKKWHICDSKSWRNATTYEKDTFGWKDSTDGAIKKGNVTDTIYVFDKSSWRAASNVEAKLGGCVSAIADSVGKVSSVYYIANKSVGKVGLVYYICKSNAWVEADALEYDTYKWTGQDGDARFGNVNTSICYVYENKVWRSGNDSDCSLGLRGCTALRQDTVVEGSDNVWRICDRKSWRNATTYEKDTFGWKNGTDGEFKKGNVTDTVYVFDKTSWHEVTTIYDYPLGTDWTNPEKTYGTLYDIRDGRTYKTIEIGGFVVMAENLNYADSSRNVYLKGNNWCYQGDSVNCLKIGRYYAWTAALDIDSKWNDATVPEGTIKKSHQGICPDGWHIPTKEEWSALFSGIGYAAQQAMRNVLWTSATNESGFSALPAGYYYSENYGESNYVGSYAYFWSASEKDAFRAHIWYMYATDAILSSSIKYNGLSVRCFQDIEE